MTIHIGRHGRKPSKFRIGEIVSNTDGFSGAELEQALIDGMFHAFSKDREVETKDILSAISHTIPLSVTMKEKTDSLRKWAKGRARNATESTTTETKKTFASRKV